MKKLHALLNELENQLLHVEKLNQKVSAVSVGWHIQHSLLAALQIIRAVEKSNPAGYKPEFNFSRLFVFTFNRIPRGKAKAPAVVIPVDTVSMETLKADFQLLRNRVGVLETLAPGHYFTHHVFGDLDIKGTIKMLKIHTKHHLDIIKDIIRG